MTGLRVGEITSLQDEVNLLRRRDETLAFYMKRVDDEMRLAARLQQDFLPKNLPQLGRGAAITIGAVTAGTILGDEQLPDARRICRPVGLARDVEISHQLPGLVVGQRGIGQVDLAHRLVHPVHQPDEPKREPWGRAGARRGRATSPSRKLRQS